MKQLVKFELYKIFKQKSIYIGLFLILLLSSLNDFNIPLVDSYKPKDLQGEMQKVSQNWEGELTNEKIEAADTFQESFIQKGFDRSLTKEEAAEDYMVQSFYDYVNVEKVAIPYRIQELDNELTKYSENDFSYKKAILEKNMLQNIKADTVEHKAGAENIIEFSGYFSRYITGIILLIGLAGIFVNENNTGMDQLVYSSKHGRRKGVTAKIIASIIYVLFVILSWVSYTVLMNTYIYGSSGWDAPIQVANLVSQLSPYDLTMLEYFLIQIGIHLLVAIAFMSFVLIVSALSKNILTSFIISGTVFILPTISFGIPLWEYVMKYSFANFLISPEFTENLTVYNLFGNPVLTPYVHYPFIAIVTIILMVVVFKTIKRKQVA
ncbi:hypothetical protein WAK64_07230 [Bacillus spongiae]|uniref:ABC transporter permease n=1 Tax=Bacillus spongiae TaxID=2683610 RepID=A0ABU8HC31_9BACI